MDVNESLLEAVRYGRVDRAGELIDTYGLSHLNSWGNGYELLKLALENRHADVAELLLSRGSKVYSGTSALVPCNTPLQIAARNGDIKIVEMIINKMLEIDAKKHHDSTPLHVAIKNKAKEAVELLLKHGADVHATDYETFTPLHLAVEKGYQEIIIILLSNGANVNAKDKNGWTPLHLAVCEGYQEITIILLSNGANVNGKTNYYESTPLLWAVEDGYQEIIIMLLANGANVNAKDYLGCTPLHLAVEDGYQEIIIILLSNGANVNAKDKNGWTPLHCAVYKGDQEIIISLLLHGADLNAMSTYEGTPLDLAVRRGDPDFLLECQKEIANMKIEQINKANISFYDILTITTSSLEIYMRNEEVVAVLESDNYAKKIPNYFDMIKSKLRKGMERKELLEQSNQILYFFINNFDCTDKISNYLSNQDIRGLIDALKP